MTASWRMRAADPESVRRLVRTQNLPEVVAQLLVCRGHRESDAVGTHLAASLKTLHEPALLPDMDRATERLARAVEAGETILIHGDYDVDGVTGTALLVRLFRLLGARVVPHIPNRLSDGYSFGAHSVARALAVEARVVVSVDNGTSAGETIAQLGAHGIDTIVTDHHEPPQGPLPDACALVNPKLHGGTYPFRELCGSGVAFKLAWGLCQRLSGARAGGKVREDLRQFLGEAMAYVALATVCDVVPLIGENRVLARHGLLALGRARSAGLQALLTACGLDGRTLSSEDVAYKLGPRLNAAGRLGSADRALDLLLCEEPLQARNLALELERLNQRRREVESEVLAEALVAAEPYADASAHPMLVLAGQGWHQGVVGIVAARLVQRFRRPALVIGLAGDTGRGSARSVPGFDVLDAMHGGAGHMLRYGGHAAAAGCEVQAGAIDALRAGVRARAAEMLGGGAHPPARLWIDCGLPLAQVDEQLMRHLERLEPFGQENEQPILYSADLRLAEEPRSIGQAREHLLLSLRQGATVHKALAFGMAHRKPELAMGRPVHAVFTPRRNTFRGRTAVELLLHDFASGDAPVLLPTSS